MFAADQTDIAALLSGVQAALAWGVVGFFVWWLMFSASLGRRRFYSRRVIRAPAEAVWRAYLDEAPPESWTGGRAVASRAYIGAPPTQVRIARRVGATQRETVERIVVFTPFSAFEMETDTVDGVAAGAAQYRREALKLWPDAQGLRAEFVVERNVRGVYHYLVARRLYARGLDRLRAHCEGRKLARATHGLGPVAWLALAGLGLIGSALLFGAQFGMDWELVVMAAAILEAAVLVHETGHWLAMRWFGHRDATVALVPFLGGAAIPDHDISSRFEKAMIALMGPAFSALAILLLFPLFDWAFAAWDAVLAAVQAPGSVAPLMQAHILKGVVGFVALLFAGFAMPINLWNLIPVGALDGGLIVSALARGRSERVFYGALLGGAIAYCIGEVFAVDFSSTLALLALVWVISAAATKTTDSDLAALTAGERATIVVMLALTFGVYAGVMGSAATGVMQRTLHQDAAQLRSVGAAPRG